MGDFINVYIGQTLIFQKENPYGENVFKNYWQHTNAVDSLKSEYSQITPLLYPPWGLEIFSPFVITDLKTSSTLWFFSQILLVLFTIIFLFMISELSGLSNNKSVILDIALVLFAFKGTIQALSYGQPFFLISLFIVIALYSHAKNKYLPCGIFAGLAISKFTIALPLWLFLFIRKDIKSLITGIITIVILMSIFFATAHEPLTILHSYIETVKNFKSSIFNSSDPHYPYHLIGNSVSAASVSDIGSLVSMYAKRNDIWIYFSYSIVIITGITGLIFAFNQFKLHNGVLFLYLCSVLFSIMYIQWYDFMIFIVLGWIYIQNFPPRYHYTYFLINVFNFIPIGGLIKGHIFPEPWNIIHFTLPLMTLANACFFWSIITKPKNINVD